MIDKFETLIKTPTEKLKEYLFEIFSEMDEPMRCTDGFCVFRKGIKISKIKTGSKFRFIIHDTFYENYTEINTQSAIVGLVIFYDEEIRRVKAKRTKSLSSKMD